MNEEMLETLKKCAHGYDVVTSYKDGEPVRVQHVPPNLNALRMLSEQTKGKTQYAHMTTEQVIAEAKKIIKEIEDANKAIGVQNTQTTEE